MCKKIINFFIIFFLTTGDKNTFAFSSHQQELLSKYPYGLLGDDFGILKVDDLAMNTCIAIPVPFHSQKGSGYPFWQCFETKKTKLLCSGYGYFIDFGTFVTLIVIKAKKHDIYHEYISRKVVPMQSCRDYKKDWEIVTHNEKYICISGMHIDEEKNASGQMVSSWIFDKFKSKKGCSPYFLGGCSLKYQIKHGCDPNKYINK